MHTFILVIHVFACIALVLIVLLQAGKSGGLGIFGGGGGSDALFSAPSGSAFLKKATSIIAVIFIITSIGLTYLASHRGMKTITGAVPPQPAVSTAQPADNTPEPSVPTKNEE